MKRFLFAVGCVAWSLSLVGWACSPADVPNSNAQPSGAPGMVVGPSAMLEWQRQGEVVLDARRAGRFISHTVRAGQTEVTQGAPVLVIADTRDEALRATPRALWIPSRLLEIPLRRDVRQIPPGQAFERARRGEVEIIDVSEAHEWEWERLPFGRRVDWRRVISRDRSWVPKGKPIIFACRLGGRSQNAARILAREGFDAANLSGGVWAWQGAKLPITQGDANG